MFSIRSLLAIGRSDYRGTRMEAGRPVGKLFQCFRREMLMASTKGSNSRGGEKGLDSGKPLNIEWTRLPTWTHYVE